MLSLPKWFMVQSICGSGLIFQVPSTKNYESFEEKLSKKMVEVKVAAESDDVSMRRICWFGYECNSINNLIVKEVPFLRSIE